MRGTFYLVAVLLAACGGDDAALDELLAARRAALGLASGPLAFRDAMGVISRRKVEPRLARLASGAAPGPEALDEALRLGSLFGRIREESAGEYRAGHEERFGLLLRRARRASTALARALARDSGESAAAAGAMVAACMDCHALIGLPR